MIGFSETAEKQGKIVAVNPIYYTLSNHYIYGYDYEIYDSELGQIFGASYGKVDHIKLGDNVTIEYLKNDPSIHRIKGMRNSFFIDITIIYFLTSIIGLLFIAYGVKHTWLFLKIVKNGYVTTARLSEKPTSTLIEETRYFIMKFSFRTKKGESIKITKELSNPKNILDDEEELIVYDENNPSNNFFIDRLPEKLKEYIYNEIKKHQNKPS